VPANAATTRRTAVATGNAPSSGGIVLKKLSPASPGAKRLATRYGDALVCVRYREDAAGHRRLTTVELVVDERPIPISPPSCVRIAYEEAELRSQVKAAGGIWDRKQQVWRVPKAAIRKLKLEHRVVPEKA